MHRERAVLAPSRLAALARTLRTSLPMVLALALLLPMTAPPSSAEAAPTPISPQQPVQPAAPVRPCQDLASIPIQGDTNSVVFTVESAVEHPGDGTLPPSCRVRVIATHPPAQDRTTIWVWLPTTNWNGRFQGTGGSGFSGGSEANLPGPLREGYAAAATDAGHDSSVGGSFALKPDGSLNWIAIRGELYLGIHEMTVAGKALTEAFFGQPPRYSYFTGCSTGGRQGLEEAQRYPNDYDGILAGAPAAPVPQLRVAGLYEDLVERESNNVVAACKWAAASEAAVQACDSLDGVTDGILADPRLCQFDPQSLLGTTTDCGAFTQADIDVIRKVWGGYRNTDGVLLWPARTRPDIPTKGPSAIGVDFTRHWLVQDPGWDPATLTYQLFDQLFIQAVEQYSHVSTAMQPGTNLDEFRAAGGKVLIWQGWKDPLLPPDNVIEYFQRVEDKGPRHPNANVRLFMAPGVGHCGGGPGPQPVGMLNALVEWVEGGKAPDMILAEKRDANGTVVQTRPLCNFPLVARYQGSGSTDDARNFMCHDRF